MSENPPVDKKVSAPPTGAPNPNGSKGNHSPTDPHYTTPSADPQKAQQALQNLIEALPAEAREKFLKAFNRHLTSQLAASGVKIPPQLEISLFNLTTLDASTILTTDYPPVPTIVPDYLTVGLSFLVGKPKTGKSWLALQLALAALKNGKLFGKDVQPCSVLYFSLEDYPRRLQERMRIQGWPVIKDRVQFVLGEEFYNKIGALNRPANARSLQRYIEIQGFKLIIVDTFSLAIDGDQLKAEEMVHAISPLQQFALKHGIAILLVDHMPKSAGGTDDFDPISHIYGSVAKAGIMDTVWALYRERGRYGGGTLAVTGREIDSRNMRLIFHKESGYWSCEGDVEDLHITERRQEVLDILKEIGPNKATVIARALDADLSNTLKRLRDLCLDGKIKRLESGVYVLAE